MGPPSGDEGQLKIELSGKIGELASMGPSSADDGEKKKSEKPGLTMPASMGPSSADDGELHSHDQMANLIELASMGPSSADDGEGGGLMSLTGHNFRARLREVRLPMQILHVSNSANVLSLCQDSTCIREH